MCVYTYIHTYILIYAHTYDVGTLTLANTISR
jgi:hypothetical protein